MAKGLKVGQRVGVSHRQGRRRAEAASYARVVRRAARRHDEDVGAQLVDLVLHVGPAEQRLRIWNKLASDWKLDHLEAITTELPNLEALDERIGLLLQGKHRGRAIVKISD